jgi:hypothetical protein
MARSPGLRLAGLLDEAGGFCHRPNRDDEGA